MVTYAVLLFFQLFPTNPQKAFIVFVHFFKEIKTTFRIVHIRSATEQKRQGKELQRRLPSYYQERDFFSNYRLYTLTHVGHLSKAVKALKEDIFNQALHKSAFLLVRNCHVLRLNVRYKV